MDSEPIIITIRDTNGKREDLRYENVSDFNSNFQPLDDEDYEILMVIWGDYCVYSALQSENGIYFEDLAGFFA